MYSINGNKYLNYDKDYSDPYRNRTKNVYENKSELKRNGELLINNLNTLKPSKGTTQFYNNPYSKQMLIIVIKEKSDNPYHNLNSNYSSQKNNPYSYGNLSLSLPEKNFKRKDELNNPEKIKKNLEEVYKKKVGLDNIGNSCYMYK